MRSVWAILKDTVREFFQDGVPRLAAALSYYTIFSLPAVLVIALALAGFVFGTEAARGELETQIQGLVGDEGARAIQTMIENAGREDSHGMLATVLGLVMLAIGATGVFGELQSDMNAVWGVKAAPRSGRLWSWLRKRLLSFGMVLVIGFLLLVSLVLSALLAGFEDLMRRWFAHESLVDVIEIANFIVSFLVITVLLGAIYVILPDAKVPWRAVWVGAGVTALLFVIGKSLIGLYLGRSATASTYGAAGSLAVLLIWVYYSSIILFLGAEFTQVYMRHRGQAIVPEEHATRVEKQQPQAA
jgi:membrane protein